MKDFKGTKGMWIVGIDIDTDCLAVMPESMLSGSNEVICILPSSDLYDDRENSDSELESNAQLIAAAPELLNACFEALKYVSCEEPAYHIINNAIAQALGKEMQP